MLENSELSHFWSAYSSILSSKIGSMKLKVTEGQVLLCFNRVKNYTGKSMRSYSEWGLNTSTNYTCYLKP